MQGAKSYLSCGKLSSTFIISTSIISTHHQHFHHQHEGMALNSVLAAHMIHNK